jgi:outer membrane protein TolC
MAAVSGIVAGITALGALAGGYSAVKQAETADMAAQEQIKMAGEQNEAAKTQVEQQKADALKQRKGQIDIQRQQILGGNFNLNPTGAAGVLPNGGLLNSAPNYNTLTGVTLG